MPTDANIHGDIVHLRLGDDRMQQTSRSFLSCLRGSERFNGADHTLHLFLSCLRGSELHERTSGERGRFLSCLRGSGQHDRDRLAERMFLSCLRGSEASGQCCPTHPVGRMEQ